MNIKLNQEKIMNQTNMNADQQSNQPPVVTPDFEPPENEKDYDREWCPACGAKHTYWNRARDHWQWLGLGETDWCSTCGAEHEHASHTRKRQLNEWRPAILLQTARDVESAYEDINRPMTHEQIAMNRDYFKRLIETIASSDLYYIPDRVEQSEAAQRLEELRGEAATLMEEVHGMGRVFYKHASRGLSEDEMLGLIAELKMELAAKVKAA